MASLDDVYSSRIFLNAVLPLVKVIVENTESLGKGFEGKTAKIQISAKTDEGKLGTHFIIENGEWTVKKGITDSPEVELEFKSLTAFNDFFKGKSKKLPRIIGLRNLSLIIAIFKTLLKMAAMLGAKEPPKKEEEKVLLVRLYFYLLSSGISQLNKAGHPEVSKWAKKSPDRVYAFAVKGKPELSAYIRVKAGNTKSARGQYTRSKPFFTMRFDSIDSALGILLQTDNLIEATIKGRLIMEGAPEFGAQIGEFMTMVGEYAK